MKMSIKNYLLQSVCQVLAECQKIVSILSLVDDVEFCQDSSLWWDDDAVKKFSSSCYSSFLMSSCSSIMLETKEKATYYDALTEKVTDYDALAEVTEYDALTMEKKADSMAPLKRWPTYYNITDVAEEYHDETDDVKAAKNETNVDVDVLHSRRYNADQYCQCTDIHYPNLFYLVPYL